jgi:hypothetical protein
MPALKRLRQENHKFKASLDYNMSISCLKTKKAELHELAGKLFGPKS